MRAVVFHESRVLDESELIDFRGACPACGDALPRRAVYRIQEKPDVELLECSRCRACCASMMPTPEVLDRYYAGYYDKNRSQMTFHGVRRFAKHIVSGLRGMSFGREARILDFGGGNGSLSVAVGRELLKIGQAKSIEAVLVDYSPPLEITEPGIRIERKHGIEDAGGPFRLILASAVLEHIPDLRKALTGLLGLLEPGGVLYARTPYVVPLARLAGKIDFGYPGHVHDLGDAFWNGVPQTFDCPARIILSQPSIVETSFLKFPLRTLAAYAMKAPARLETRLSNSPGKNVRWKLVGGWEIFLRMEEPFS
jgi:hypothetical protein